MEESDETDLSNSPINPDLLDSAIDSELVNSLPVTDNQSIVKQGAIESKVIDKNDKI